MRILIDLDSITVDLLQPWLNLYNADYDDHLTVEDITSWDTHLSVKPACGMKIYDYLKRPGFFAGLKPLPGAQAAIANLYAAGHRLYMVTAAPDGSATEKVHWVSEWLPFLNAKKQTVICFDKHIIDGDVLIDDSPKNLVNWKAAHPDKFVMGIRYPYNTNTKVAGLLAEGWQDTELAWKTMLRYINSLAHPQQLDLLTRYERA